MAARLEKKCRICGIMKSMSGFQERKESRDGRRSECRECLNKVRRDRSEAARRPKEVIPEGYSKCTKCQMIKTNDNFHSDVNGKNGLSNWCKQCKKDRSQENPIVAIMSNSKAEDKMRERYDPEKFITAENLERLYQHQKGYCYYCGRTMLFGVGVDRLLHPQGLTIERMNNDLGHNVDNVVFACSHCNKRRRNLYTFEQFRDMIWGERKAQFDTHLTSQLLSKLTTEPNKVTLEFKSS